MGRTRVGCLGSSLIFVHIHLVSFFSIDEFEEGGYSEKRNQSFKLRRSNSTKTRSALLTYSINRAMHITNFLKYCSISIIIAGYYPLSKNASILIVAGVWGLAILLLSNYYTTLLISYVAAPNPQPIIRSIYELRNRPDLRLVTDKNINFETIILVLYIFKCLG